MIKVGVSRFFSDLLLQLMDGARRGDRLDISTIATDQVVVMRPGNKEGEIGSSFVKTKAPNHSFVGEFLKKSKNSCLVTLL